MRLESALYSSRAGLDAHGKAIAVIGDNVANASTTGYRSSRVEFSDIMAAGVSGSDSGATASGGSGAIVSKITETTETGTLEFTGRQLDVGIGGRGYFTVGDPAAPSYTRNGSFATDSTGLLVTQDGTPVLGVAGSGVLGTDPLTTLNLKNLNTAGTPTGAMTVFGNLDAGTRVETAAPANPATFKELNAGASYVTNVTVFDSLGATHNVTLAFTKTAANTWVSQAYMDGADVGGTAGVPVQLGSNVTVNFGEGGQVPTANQAAASITAAPAYSNGAAAGNFTIGLGSFTQYAAPAQTSSITQDGIGVGSISGYEFKKTGQIYANLDNGQTVLVGSLGIADFVNPGGLTRIGNSMYAATDTVGDVTVAAGGTSGLGEIEGGSLERSTVDIANEFVNLVIYQRGYQANSQALNAANELVRDTIALMR